MKGVTLLNIGAVIALGLMAIVTIQFKLLETRIEDMAADILLLDKQTCMWEGNTWVIDHDTGKEWCDTGGMGYGK